MYDSEGLGVGCVTFFGVRYGFLMRNLDELVASCVISGIVNTRVCWPGVVFSSHGAFFDDVYGFRIS